VAGKVAIAGRLLLRGWAPFAVFLIHVLLSKGLGLYARMPWVDVPMHFLGGLATAHFLHRCFEAIPAGLVAPWIRGQAEALVVVTSTATVAIVWEFAELASDHWFGTHALKSIPDTLFDIALGMAGGATLVGLAHWRGALGRIDPIEGPG
jgi:hypothetical protein